MGKKFIIRDEDKNEFEVEEIETEKVKETDEEVEEIETEQVKDESLSETELAALKRLASFADKLIALVEIEKDEHANTEEAEMLDDDDDEETEETEEIIDTDEELVEEKVKSQDSKKSVGSIMKTSKTKDSIADSYEQDVAAAWAKRYGGK